VLAHYAAPQFVGWDRSGIFARRLATSCVRATHACMLPLRVWLTTKPRRMQCGIREPGNSGHPGTWSLCHFYETSGTYMAAKRKSEGKRISPRDTSRPSDDLKAAIEPVATALTEELAALLAAVLDGRKKKTLDRLSQALSEAVPMLLQRTIEDELLASGDIARERRARFATVLRGRETPANLPQANATGKRRRLEADEDDDWMSTDAAAQLLNLSPNEVKKLLQDGKLGDVDIDAHGVTRLERAAVLLRYQHMQRR
jgi:hypothetical protein